MLGVSETTFRAWSNGKQRIPPRRRCRTIDMCWGAIIRTQHAVQSGAADQLGVTRRTPPIDFFGLGAAAIQPLSSRVASSPAG